MPIVRPKLRPRHARRMLRPPAVILAALLLVGLSGLPAFAQDAAQPASEQPSVPMFGGNPARTGAQPGPAPEGNPVLRWEFATGGAVRSSPAVVDGTVYFGSRDGHVYAVNAETGAELWRFATGGPVIASPAVSDGVVFVGSDDGYFYALDAATGERRWSNRLWATDSPTIVDSLVFVTSWNARTLYVLDAKTGLERWHAAFSFLVSEPTVAGQSVFVGADGLVQAFDKNTGLVRWIYDAGGDIWSPLVVGNGRVFATISEGSNGQVNVEAGTAEGEEDTPPDADENSDAGGSGAFAATNRIVALDTETGQNRWTYSFGSFRAPMSAAALVDGILYVGSPQGWLYAVDADSGRQLWGYQTDGFVAASPVVAGGHVIVGSFGGGIHALDAKTGAVQWIFQAGAPVVSTAAVVGGVVYVGSDTGSLLAIGGSGEPADAGSSG